jgi:hypothetical protein
MELISLTPLRNSSISTHQASKNITRDISYVWYMWKTLTLHQQQWNFHMLWLLISATTTILCKTLANLSKRCCTWKNAVCQLISPSSTLYIYIYIFFLKALTVLHGPLAYPDETFGRTPWPGDQPNTRPLPTQDNTTQKHTNTHPCPKQDSNLWSQCSSSHRQYMP